MNLDNFLQGAPLGTLAFGIADNHDKSYVVLGIKESGRNLRDLGQTVKVISNFVVAKISGVIVVAIYLDIPDWPKNRYECFYNYHANPAALNIWIAQDFQPVAFYTKEGRKRTVAISNSLGQRLAEYQTDLTEHPVWSMEQFDEAKAGYCRRITPDQTRTEGLLVNKPCQPR